jgi:hypothetical protein
VRKRGRPRRTKRTGTWRSAATVHSTGRCPYLFKPEDGAIDAHFDKGVLHLNIKKPAEDAKSAKTIEIKLGAPALQSGGNFRSRLTAVATRYDKRAENFLAGVKLASLRIWTHFNESMT